MGLANKLDDYNKKVSGKIPVAKIKIDGKDLKFSDKENVLIKNLEVLSSVGPEASTCFIELAYYGVFSKKSILSKKLEPSLPNLYSKFKAGSKLEISINYEQAEAGKLESAVRLAIGKDNIVFVGYISSVDLEINNRNVTNLQVNGMDTKMWMMSNRKTNLIKEKHKYSDVVKNVCNGYRGKLEGISVIKINKDITIDCNIYQQDESDYDFLNRLAKITGSLFFIDKGKLHFISISALKSKKLTISPCESVYNISSSTSVWGIPDKVEVLGKNLKDYKKVIKGSANNSDAIGSGKTAGRLTSNISSDFEIVNSTAHSVKEAKFFAESILNQREINLHQLNVRVKGYPDISLGTGVQVKDFGNPIDNNYIVTEIKHSCDFENNSYFTDIKMNTNRVNPQKTRYL